MQEAGFVALSRPSPCHRVIVSSYRLRHSQYSGKPRPALLQSHHVCRCDSKLAMRIAAESANDNLQFH
jgi:hypothetical protein